MMHINQVLPELINETKAVAHVERRGSEAMPASTDHARKPPRSAFGAERLPIGHLRSIRFRIAATNSSGSTGFARCS